MDAQRLAHELNHHDAQEMLRSAPMAPLAYNGADGLPRVIPCGFYAVDHDQDRRHLVTSPS
jgi:hypothetical protein